MEEDLKEISIIINSIRGVLQKDIKPTDENVYSIDGRQFIAIENLLQAYTGLVKVSTETAFDTVNEDTEFLCRLLLKQGQIEFNKEKFEYINPRQNKEFEVNGIMYTKEKIFFINDDELDDYTKQLEEKNREQGNIINTANIAIKDLQEKLQDAKTKVEELEQEITVLEQELFNKTIKIREYEKTLENLQKETIWKSKAKEKLEELSTYDYVKLEEGDIAIDTVLAELEKKENMYRKEYNEHMEKKRQNGVLINNELILKRQLEKKDNIINIMAEHLEKHSTAFLELYGAKAKDWINYYEREVEK